MDRDALLSQVEAILARFGFSRGSHSKKSTLTVFVKGADDQALIRLHPGRRSQGLTIARKLAAHATRVSFLECDITPGSRGKEITASQLVFRDSGIKEHDMSSDAADILEEIADGQPVYDEDMAADEVVEYLLEDVNLFAADFDSELLEFRSNLSPRLQPFAEAIASGNPWSWTEIGGQQALQVSMNDGRQISVLSEAERQEFHHWLKANGSVH